jgi:hypothetical protein
MSIQIGETVIVTQQGVNRVGVVLDKFIASKRTVYDVLLENRTAVCMIGSTRAETYVNTTLTDMLCKTEQIETTIPYKELLNNDLLPITKS